MIIHVGKKVPKEFTELPGGIHLGNGMWILPMEIKKEKHDRSEQNADTTAGQDK